MTSHKYAYFASGFREQRGEHTGTKANANDIRAKYQSRDCTVIYCEYDDAPKQYALDLASQWNDGDTLLVCGYSWGCGNWIRKFLWELYKVNPLIVVNYLTLVDPVVYTRLFSFRWMAITNWGTIKLPANIEKCFVFYQRVDEPNASKLKFEGNPMPAYSELDYPHTKIDNAPEVTDHLHSVAAHWLSSDYIDPANPD